MKKSYLFLAFLLGLSLALSGCGGTASPAGTEPGGEQKSDEPAHSDEPGEPTEPTEPAAPVTELADGVYRIRNEQTKRALNMQLAGMVDRAYAQQFADTGMTDELWQFTQTEPGVYSIANVMTGRYLAARQSPPSAGADIQVTVTQDGLQLWTLYHGGDGYRLVPVNGDISEGMGLPEASPKTSNLPKITVYHQDATSHWLLESVSLPQDIPVMLPLEGDLFHSSCPQIIKHGDSYYMYIMAPGISIKKSTDLIHWESIGKVFGTDPSWLAQEVPGYGIWAPSVYKIGDKYYLYYCISTIGSQNSAIGLAVNETLDPADPNYRWVDQGMVLRSRTGSDYNCIDPNIIIDDNGEVWLNFGSYWNGLYQYRIDPQTGHLADPEEDPIHLARRWVEHGAVEAPYMVWRDGYYYMFVAFNPMNLSYHNRVGRSESVHGPFVDRDGVEMLQGGGTVVTQGLYELQMPGHASVFEDDDGQWYFVGEYFRENSASIMMISTILWDDEGWPLTALTPGMAIDN